jgi:hypothetical protein
MLNFETNVYFLLQSDLESSVVYTARHTRSLNMHSRLVESFRHAHKNGLLRAANVNACAVLLMSLQ